MPSIPASNDTLAAALHRIGASSTPDNWGESWSQSVESYTPGKVFFLTEPFIRETCSDLSWEADIAQVLVDAAAKLSADANLARLAWHCYLLFFIAEENAAVGSWPALPKTGDDAAALLYACVFLGGAKLVREKHRALNIDEAVTLATLADLRLWMREHHKQHGAWGFAQVGWLASHFSLRLFHLGRIQFEFGVYRAPFRAFRHRHTRAVLLLAEADKTFRPDGQFASADGGNDSAGAWASTLAIDAETISGHPVIHGGVVQQKRIDLAAADWEGILTAGDPVLSIHIPATGSMRHDDCEASFKHAGEFFARHFPNFNFRAFTCSTWLLDPQLAAALPAESNIVRFLNGHYLHPKENANPLQTYERVFGFGVDSCDPATAPRETSLQRAIVAHVEAGGCWRDGAGLRFSEDLGNEKWRWFE